MDIDLIKQLSVLVIFCIDNAENTLQNADVRKIFFLDCGKVEHKRYIPDSVCLNVMIDRFHSVYLHLFVINRRDFRRNIFSSKHRDLRQIFRRGFFFLIGFQIFCILHKFLNLFFGQTFFIRLQFLCKLPIHSRSPSLLRSNNYDRPMRILQKIISDQLLKIACFDLTFQKLKCRNRLHMDKRFFFIIKPAVEQLKSVHQSSRITSEVCLSETELIIIQSSLQCLFINSAFCNISQRIFNHFHKRFLLLHICIFRNNRKNRLINSIII